MKTSGLGSVCWRNYWLYALVINRFGHLKGGDFDRINYCMKIETLLFHAGALELFTYLFSLLTLRNPKLTKLEEFEGKNTN